MRECSPPQTCHMSRVMCHVSRVMCHVSRVTCHMIHIYIFFFPDKVVKFIGGGSVINGAYPVYFFSPTRVVGFESENVSVFMSWHFIIMGHGNISKPEPKIQK